jgi:hypothetical protein
MTIEVGGLNSLSHDYFEGLLMTIEIDVIYIFFSCALLIGLFRGFLMNF